MLDAIVLGGGPAGLQAATTLGRVHRRVLVIDSGEYRNATVAHLHNLAGSDGMPPAELRANARRDLAAYPVTFRDGTATGVAGELGAVEVTLADGSTERARAVVLATGVRDALPDVPGLAEQWGGLVAHCPFCHGHEFAGLRVGILGTEPARLEHMTALVGPIAGELVPIAELARVERTDEGLHLTLPDGGTEDVGGLFVGTVPSPSPLVEQLGLDRHPTGELVVDTMGRTSRSGIYAAGDTAYPREAPGPMHSIANALGSGALAGGIIVRDLIALDQG